MIKSVDARTRPARREDRAFSLVEALVGMAVAGILLVALYASLAWGFASLRLTRENLRATQILTEKMETIRLYSWEQLTVETNFMPTNFTASYYPPGATNTYGAGTAYRGRMSLNPVSLGTDYEDDIRLVTIEVEWATGGVARRRALKTFVSQYGLQNYVW